MIKNLFEKNTKQVWYWLKLPKVTNLKNCTKGHQFLRHSWCSLHDLLVFLTWFFVLLLKPFLMEISKRSFANGAPWDTWNTRTPRNNDVQILTPLILCHLCMFHLETYFWRHIKMYNDGGKKASFICFLEELVNGKDGWVLLRGNTNSAWGTRGTQRAAPALSSLPLSSILQKMPVAQDCPSIWKSSQISVKRWKV